MNRLKNVIVLLLLLAAFAPKCHGLSDDPVIQQAAKLQHSNPNKATILLRDSLKTNQQLADQVYFDRQFLRMFLQYRAGFNLEASTTWQQMQKRLAGKQSLDQWMSVAQAFHQISNLNVKDAQATLKPVAQSIRASDDKDLIMWFEVFLGNTEHASGRYENAMNSLNKAFNLANERQSSLAKMQVLNQLLNLYYYMGDFAKAESTNSELEKLAIDYKDELMQVLSLSNQANILYMKSQRQGQLVSSAKTEESKQAAARAQEKLITEYYQMLDQVIQRSQTIDAFKIELRAIILKQNYHNDNGQYRESVKFAEAAIALAEKKKVPFEKAVSYNNLSISYRALGEHVKAIEALQKAEVIYKEIGQPQYLLWVQEDYSIAYEMNKDYEQALKYYKQYHQAAQELLKTTNSEKVLELQATFDSERNANEIKRLNQQNRLKESELKAQNFQLLLMILVGLLLCIVLFSVYYRNRLISAKNQKLDEFNQKLKQQAYIDPLSGIYNRRMIGEVKKRISSLANPDPQQSALVMLDIDFFKRVNDEHGHDIGDQVIQFIAKELTDNLRADDLALRWGGEEFLVILFNTNENGARQFCQRILDARNNTPITIGDKELYTTVSIGYGLYPSEADNGYSFDWEESLKLIDNSLYFAKQGGRNRAVSIDLANSRPENKSAFLDLEAATQCLAQSVIKTETLLASNPTS